MTDDEDNTPTLLLQSAAHGTAAKILITHLLIALARKGMLRSVELDELLDESKAFARGLGGPREFVELVLRSIDADSHMPPAKSGDLH